MKLIKKSKSNEMLDIYECNECHNNEYYGMFHWHNNQQFCRSCIYHIWMMEEYRNAKRKEEVEANIEHRKPLFERLSYWRPTEKDLVFPYYSDGVNYSKNEEDYESGV